MTTPAYTPKDVVNYAASKDAVNLATAFNDMIAQRMQDAIQARKVEIASAMFNPPAEEQAPVEASGEEEEQQEEGQGEEQVDDVNQPDEESEETDEDAE